MNETIFVGLVLVVGVSALAHACYEKWTRDEPEQFPATEHRLNNCSVCGVPSMLRCGGCKTDRSWYCSVDHQKEAWKDHRYRCYPSSQLGLCIDSNNGSATPVYVSQPRGEEVEDMPLHDLSRIVGCPTTHLALERSDSSRPMLPEDHTMVFASDGGEDKPIYDIQTWRSSLKPGVVFFYKQPGKDLLLDPDYLAMQEVNRFLLPHQHRNLPLEEATRIAQTFVNRISKPPASLGRNQRIEACEALFFSAYDTRPRIIKVPCLYSPPIPKRSEGALHQLNHPLLGDLKSTASATIQAYDGKPLPQPYRVYFRSNFVQENLPRNLCIGTLTKNVEGTRWKGNIVVFKECGGGSETFVDLEGEADVRIIVSFFRAVGDRLAG